MDALCCKKDKQKMHRRGTRGQPNQSGFESSQPITNDGRRSSDKDYSDQSSKMTKREKSSSKNIRQTDSIENHPGYAQSQSQRGQQPKRSLFALFKSPAYNTERKTIMSQKHMIREESNVSRLAPVVAKHPVPEQYLSQDTVTVMKRLGYSNVLENQINFERGQVVSHSTQNKTSKPNSVYFNNVSQSTHVMVHKQTNKPHSRQINNSDRREQKYQGEPHRPYPSSRSQTFSDDSPHNLHSHSSSSTNQYYGNSQTTDRSLHYQQRSSQLDRNNHDELDSIERRRQRNYEDAQRTDQKRRSKTISDESSHHSHSGSSSNQYHGISQTTDRHQYRSNQIAANKHEELDSTGRRQQRNYDDPQKSYQRHRSRTVSDESSIHLHPSTNQYYLNNQIETNQHDQFDDTDRTEQNNWEDLQRTHLSHHSRSHNSASAGIPHTQTNESLYYQHSSSDQSEVNRHDIDPNPFNLLRQSDPRVAIENLHPASAVLVINKPSTPTMISVSQPAGLYGSDKNFRQMSGNSYHILNEKNRKADSNENSQLENTESRDNRYPENRMPMTSHNPQLIQGSNVRPISQPSQIAPQVDAKMEEFIYKIVALQEKAVQFEDEVNMFSGTKQHPKYYYIDENLTRILFELDKLDVEYSNELRMKRRSVIKYIYGLLAHLEDKANMYAGVPEYGMEVVAT